jgi:UDP-N-acetylglucosamine:LPS N-acetylglucosamine transferase
MVISRDLTRIAHRVQLPPLDDFQAEFGAVSDFSRYDRVHRIERVTSREAAYLNQLQLEAYIPTRTVLLLKNNLHDLPFIAHTTRSVLYNLKQAGKMGDRCFQLLHQKLDAKDFLSLFRYLYILMLYNKLAESHDVRSLDPAFRFESLEHYSNKLAQTPSHTLMNEELKLQQAHRKRFLKEHLLFLSQRGDCPEEARQQITVTMRALDPLNFVQFRAGWIQLFNKIEKFPELERICWKELQNNLANYHGEDFFNQAYLRLKTESYYKNHLSRLTTLKQSLERTSGPNLLHLIERCKKCYNGCIHLLADSKNMPECSSTRLNAVSGKMRAEWQSINLIFSRAQGQHSHLFCACQVQSLPAQNKLADWPCHNHRLIELPPAQPKTPQQLQNLGISPTIFQENQKKTVAIFGAKWGGGHMEVSRGIATNLSSLGYHPYTIDLLELMISEDPIRNFFITRWLGTNWSFVTLYEGLLKHKAFAFINFLIWIQSKLFSPFGYKESELKLIIDHLLKLKPDSVITTCRIQHEAIIKACEILGIPYIHVATDIDTSLDSREKPTDFKHFKIAVPFNAPESINPILKTTTAAQRVISGPPVRHAFTLQRTLADIQRFKSKWGIEANKKVVIVSSGKNGAFSPYPEILAQKYAAANSAQIPIHLVVICGGDNQAFKNHLEQVVAPRTKLPMTIGLSYKEKEMEELMAMASYGGALIGKAGGGTIFEAFAKGTRILVNDEAPRLCSQGFHHFWITLSDRFFRLLGFEGQLPWEKVNMAFACKHGIADTFNQESAFLPKLEKLLNNNGSPISSSIEIKNIEKTIPQTLQAMMHRASRDPSVSRARAVHRIL